jgi:hypothetical protein
MPMIDENAMVDQTTASIPTAEEFGALVKESGHQKALRQDEVRRAALEQREALIKRLLDEHVKDDNWRSILDRAKAAAGKGEKEQLLLRFPCQLCSDGGRAINAVQPDWPETLRGEAAEIYHLWERDLKPNGFHLTARILNFPGGMPGDVGLTMVWGR